MGAAARIDHPPTGTLCVVIRTLDAFRLLLERCKFVHDKILLNMYLRYDMQNGCRRKIIISLQTDFCFILAQEVFAPLKDFFWFGG